MAMVMMMMMMFVMMIKNVKLVVNIIILEVGPSFNEYQPIYTRIGQSWSVYHMQTLIQSECKNRKCKSEPILIMANNVELEAVNHTPKHQWRRVNTITAIGPILTRQL